MPILQALGIDSKSTTLRKSIDEKEARQVLNTCLDDIGIHIDDSVDDNAAAAFLSLCGAHSPEIERVVNKHHIALRLRTISRIKRSSSVLSPTHETSMRKTLSFAGCVN